MADADGDTVVEGTADTAKEAETPEGITPSRRSSRKKQSTFSDDFEYYTPTGRKKEEDKKPSPQPIPKGKQKKGNEKGEDSEDEKSENGAKKTSNKKVAQRKQKDEEAEEESEEDKVEKPKGKVGKGKPKTVTKKATKKMTAAQRKKDAAKKQKGSSEEEEDEEEEEATTSEDSDEETVKAFVGKKRKASSVVKKQPGKAGRKKKKVEEEVVKSDESSSDEEDSTPISQLKAQMKQKQAAAKEFRQSPLAQNLSKKFLEAGVQSNSSLEGEEDKSPVPALGQKRKPADESEEISPAKKAANAKQFQKLGSALATLVKRIPPSDLGLVKRTPKEMATKVSKVKEEDTVASQKLSQSINIEESKPLEIITPLQADSVSKDIAIADKVKQEDDACDKETDIGVSKKKILKSGSSDTVASDKTQVKSEKERKTQVKSEKERLKGIEGSIKKKVKFEEKKAKDVSKVDRDKQSKNVLVKDGKISVLATGLKGGKEISVKKEGSSGKHNQSHKLSESELRQKKIEQIKAKIAEKSAGQRPYLDKQSPSKHSDGSHGKHIKKENSKDSELRQKKLEQIKAKVEDSSKKFSNLPSHLLKKKSWTKGHGKSNDDVIKRGLVLKKKSHQPFGKKHIVKRLSDTSPNSKEKTGEAEKKNKPERDKIKKPEERKRKSSESDKRKSIESVKNETERSSKDHRLSSDGNKKQSSSSEKRRKSSASEDGPKEMNKSGNEPPLLTPASAAVPTKTPKHKHNKQEHEVPIDMSMMDLFKPDGLIAHDPATSAAATATSTSQSEPLQTSTSSSSPGRVRPEDVHHVLLEHQYSKTSSAAGGNSGSERGLSTSGTYQQKSDAVVSGRDDVESMSHNNSVIMDASLPEQILEESAEELVTSSQGDASTAQEGGKQDNLGDRASILESLDTELKESGTDFLIVGQVEVSRQTSEVSSVSSSSSSAQKTEGKKGDGAPPATEGSSRKRKDSERSTGSRKKSTDSQGSAANGKKDKSPDKKDHKKKKAEVKGKEKGKEEAEEDEESGAEDEEFEDDENDFDWEDPDMLYCVCRKPHNNRFMICCDKCEEWYHGTCVGITRARGKEMEDNEEEYTCPICIKGDGISVLEKVPASSKSTEMSSPSSKLLQKCVGRKCNKTPRSGSVYCSNECIMNHAQESLKAIRDEQAKKTSKEKHPLSQESTGNSTSSKTTSTPATSSSDVVEVMERETGKILKGPSAPTQKGLHRWLEQHPSFEVVQPHKHRSSSRDSRDSKEEHSSEKKEKERRASSTSSSSNDKKSDKNGERSHHHHHHRHHHKDSSRRESSGGSSSREHSAKKIDTERRRSSSSSSSSQKVESSSHSSLHRKEENRSERGSSGGPNQIRINVRTALRDCLGARAKEADDILLSSNEIKVLALEIEERLYDLFNDTGHKYRAKYRSLIFNIKDQKNKGLFRKILTGKISPDKLVLMSTEDLASRELAKWREQESKHQLEMIEKLEKEKQETKNTNHVTKKTHKGEIEVNEEDLSTLETRLEEKKETEPEKTDDHDSEPAIDTTSQHRAHLFDLNCKVCTGKIVPGPEEQIATKVTVPPKKKTGVVQFSLPEDEEEEKSEPKQRNNSSNSEEKKEMEEEDYEKAAEIVKEALEHVHKAEEELSSLPSMVSSSPKHHEPALSPPISPKDEPEDVDEDMEVEKLEREAGLTPPSPSKASGTAKAPFTNASSSAAMVAATAPEKKVVVRSPDSALQSGLEAKAKFTPTSPVLWKGFVSMLDVAKFFTSAYRVSGPVDHISIPDTVHIMGRISPDHMWDYLSKIRQAGSKDITVLRFIPGSDEEKVAYIHLYSYLNSRARCGVANNPSRQVKDFYIVPLASHSKIPRTLLPFDGPGLEENRPHMLIGILVRQREKHSKDASVDSDSPHSSTSSKADKVVSSSAGNSDSGNTSSSSKVRASLSGARRDPRLAKLAAKAESPKHSPTGSSTENSSEPKLKGAQPSSELDEYDPEYVPLLGKAKGSSSQPIAEYIPTPTAKKKDKEDKNKASSSSEKKKAVKSKTPSPEDSSSSDVKEKHHHNHHHHHHKEHHRHHHHKEHHGHDRKVEEDDSEPYSPSKEAEPYSPGMEAAAEEPYDPEDESLMDDEGHPIASATTASVTAAASTTTNSDGGSASCTTSSSATGTITSSISKATTGDGKVAEDPTNLSSEELVERMARSNDPSQISTLMVMALSKASTQQEQQQLLVKLTRQVEDRKLQLAEEMQRSSGQSQDTAAPSVQKEQSEVTSSDVGEEKSKEKTSPLGSTHPSLMPQEEVATGTGEKESASINGNSSTSLPSAPPTSNQIPPSDTTATIAEKASSSSGVKFSIKPLGKSSLKPVTLGNAFSSSSGKDVQQALESTSSDKTHRPTVSEATSLSTAQSKALSEETEKVGGDEVGRPELPDALKALMNDVMGGAEAPSLEQRSKKLLKKEAERTAAMSSQKAGGAKEESEKEVEGGKEKDEQKKRQEIEAANLEAQRRLDDEMEARRILDNLKKTTPTNSAAAEPKPTVDPVTKPTTAPSIDELLDRLKKGGFQFPMQKSADGAGASSSSSLPSVSSSAGYSAPTPASSASPTIDTPPPSLPPNPSVPTYTASKPLFPSGNVSLFSSAHSSTTSSSPLLSSAEDVDLRIGIPSQSQPKANPAPQRTSDSSTFPSEGPTQTGGRSPQTLQDRDDRLLYHHQDRDDRAFRPGSGPKHPLDPHSFPPLPGVYSTPRVPLPPGSDIPSYQPTQRTILPPKGRAQPPPPGTEFDKPAGVLGITDVDLRHPPLPPLPPQPPPPLPPLPHHQFCEDVDYRNPDPYRPHHHGYNRGRGGHPYHRP